MMIFWISITLESLFSVMKTNIQSKKLQIELKEIISKNQAKFGTVFDYCTSIYHCLTSS